jgi:hypothetical protein
MDCNQIGNDGEDVYLLTFKDERMVYLNGEYSLVDVFVDEMTRTDNFCLTFYTYSRVSDGYLLDVLDRGDYNGLHVCVDLRTLKELTKDDFEDGFVKRSEMRVTFISVEIVEKEDEEICE